MQLGHGPPLLGGLRPPADPEFVPAPSTQHPELTLTPEPFSPTGRLTISTPRIIGNRGSKDDEAKGFADGGRDFRVPPQGGRGAAP